MATPTSGAVASCGILARPPNGTDAPPNAATSRHRPISVPFLRGTVRGVERDDVQARMWLNLAASRTKGGKARRRIMSKRDSVAARLTLEQVTEAQRLAQEWRPRAP